MTNCNHRMMLAAEEVSKNGTCDRARVGAVITRGNYIIGKGWNTSPKDLPTCDEVGHLMIEGHCCRTIHAEVNAILDVLQSGRDIRGAMMYVTHEPCIHCRKLIIQSGIKKVYFKNEYRSLSTTEMNGNVEWVHYKGDF